MAAATAGFLPTQQQQSLKSFALAHFAGRLFGLKTTYRHLDVDYNKLSLTSRRYLFGNAHTPVPDIRASATAKFALAAVLQWSPTSFNFRYPEYFDEGVSLVSANGTGEGNELCPAWLGFFDDIVQADEMLSRWDSNGAERVSEEYMSEVNQLLSISEAKAIWVQSLLLFVQNRGEYVAAAGGMELQDWMVFEGWNRFCLSVARGAGLDASVAALGANGRVTQFRPPEILPEELIETDGRRTWFPFFAGPGSEPWMCVH